MQGYYTRLGSCVVGKLRSASDPDDAGDCNDSAVSGPEHAREEGLECVEVGEEIDGYAMLDLLYARVEKGAAIDDTSVVDQDCRGAELNNR